MTLVIKPVIHLRVFPHLNLMQQILIIFILNTIITVLPLLSGAIRLTRLGLSLPTKKLWAGPEQWVFNLPVQI